MTQRSVRWNQEAVAAVRNSTRLSEEWAKMLLWEQMMETNMICAIF